MTRNGDFCHCYATCYYGDSWGYLWRKNVAQGVHYTFLEQSVF